MQAYQFIKAEVAAGRLPQRLPPGTPEERAEFIRHREYRLRLPKLALEEFQNDMRCTPTLEGK